MFKKNKNPNNEPAKALSRKELDKEAKAYMQSAKQFEQSEIERTRKFAKFAWISAGLCLFVAGAAVFAVAGLTPLKTAVPFVIRVDNSTGATDIVSIMKTKEENYGEVVDKYWLAKYVRDREGYDWYTLQASYNATMLLSDVQEQEKISKIFNHPTAAPHKVLKDKFRVEIEITSISFIAKETAQVRFTKQVVPLYEGDSKPAPEKYIATIGYEYRSAPQDESDRLINPLGFQVMSYRADPEKAE